jgi:hypothetical protein
MQLKRSVRRLLGRRPAGRELGVFPDDTFVVSYPRSGNTWTRFLIANLIGRPTLESISAMIPEIYLFSNRHLLRLPRPRILKSHEPFDPRYKKVIYIARDPRDVAVSLYHYSRKRRDIPDGFPMEEFVARYVRGEYFDFCGTWQQHVASWLYTQPDRQMLWLRYEDMLDRAEEALCKIADFMRISITPEKVASAIQASSYETLREMERNRPREMRMTKDTRTDIPFIRNAAKGGWRSVLSGDSQHRIENAWGEMMNRLGYPAEMSGRTALAADAVASASRSGLSFEGLDSPAVA